MRRQLNVKIHKVNEIHLSKQKSTTLRPIRNSLSKSRVIVTHPWKPTFCSLLTIGNDAISLETI